MPKILVYVGSGSGYVEVELPSTPTPSAPSGGVLYQPGGTADPANGVYTDFPSAFDAATATPQPSMLYIDTSMGEAMVPAGRTYDGAVKVTLGPKGRSVNTPPVLTVEDGATLSDLVGIDNIEIQSTATLANPIAFSYADLDEASFSLTDGAVVHMLPGATMSGIAVPAAKTLNLSTQGNVTLKTESTSGSGNVLTADASGTVKWFANEGLSLVDSVAAKALAAASPGAIAITADASITVPSYAGAVEVTPTAQAGNLAPLTATTPEIVGMTSFPVGTMAYVTDHSVGGREGAPAWWNGTNWLDAAGSIVSP